MMAERAQTWLIGLLAAQIALALALAFGEGDGGAAEARRPLVSFDPARVARVEIASPDGAAVLARSEAADEGASDWAAPRLNDFPVDGARVERLLSELAEAARGWSVAERGAAAERFAVDPELFQKRLTLTAGGREIGPIYLGTSPAIGVAHARLEGGDEIYAIDIDAVNAAADDDSWVLRDQLDLDDADVARIQIASGGETVTLIKDPADAAFTLADLSEGEILDAEAVRSAVAAALRPDYSGLAPASEADGLLASPEAEIVVTLVVGTSLRTVFASEANETEAAQTDAGAEIEAPPTGPVYFSRSDFEPVFRGRAEDFAALLAAGRDSFLTPPPEPASDAEAASETEPPAAQAEGAAASPAAEPSPGAEPDAGASPPEPEPETAPPAAE